VSNSCISTERIIAKLDEYLHKNDYVSAERHLLYWLDEATRADDRRTQLLLHNELMGLYRKLGHRDEALAHAQKALDTVESLGASRQVGGATSYLNAATVYKAFNMADASLPLFESALQIYEAELDSNDGRLAGLYNNMALTLVDLKDFNRADELYKKAISIMENLCDGAPEAAITYLNMANAAEARLGLVEAEELITQYTSRAQALLEGYKNRDGNYAFVCEKCASVFDYYGYFIYAGELRERSRRIYEGT